ncbi:MAG: hypothetical protein A2Z26_02325 [Deltaproteobacteria bacterium RBG_16_66_15]|nr:MAG: hypothetical protein A2Z26_02325 [Deltaproteobacteria bacterium RBG_16_66_15]
MAINVPRPFTSIAPPSSTTSRFRTRGRIRRRPRAAAARAETRSSFRQSGYRAHALNRNPATATSRFGRSLRTKIGPKSRVQPRSVGIRKNAIRERSTAARAKSRSAFASCAFDWTRIRTVSPAAIFRTISP